MLASAHAPPSDSRVGGPPALADPLPTVREAVREVLTASPAFAELEPAARRELAQSMVRVCYAAANLIREEIESGGEGPAVAAALSEAPVPRPAERRPPMARAQEAGFGEAASKIAGTTKAILNAVSFPTFVTDLINGVFKAMIDSTQTQMQNYVELLNSVAASTDGFADSQMGPARARQWLVEHYPDAFEMEDDVGDEDMASLSPEERAELEAERKEIRIRPRPGAKPPSEEALRADLGLEPGASLPSASNPEQGLVPLVRQRLAKMRQEMLATLVRMGMQRIVVDSGRISASMRFHIDTRDAVARDQASRFGISNEIAASGSYGTGVWGVSASVKNSISYVSTQREQSTREMNTDLDLNSAVEINFRSDYVPLNTLATPAQANAIRANSRNPEAGPGDAARESRIASQRAAEGKRQDSLDKALVPNALPSAPERPNLPGASTPSGGTPGSTTPGATTPGATTPGATTPGATTPGATTPGATTPGGTTPAGGGAGATPGKSAGVQQAPGGGGRAAPPPAPSGTPLRPASSVTPRK